MFPTVIDNTMRGKFVRCPRKMQLAHIDNWQAPQGSVDLVAGGAFAKGVEVARKQFFVCGATAQAAVDAGIAALIVEYGDFDAGESVKTRERMAGALVYYFGLYPLDQEKLVPVPGGIEMRMHFPLEGIAHPDTGATLEWAGRFDALCTNRGRVTVVDEKTTKTLGEQWCRQWSLDAGITGYVWMARKHGHDVAEAIIRGISILKGGYGHAEVVVQKAQWELDRWEAQIRRDILRMIEAYRTGTWDYSFEYMSCAAFRGCEYRELCESRNPDKWAEINFVKRVWNPLADAVSAS